MQNYAQFVEFFKDALPENSGILWKTSRQGSLIDIQGSLYEGFNKDHFLGESILSLFPALLLDYEPGVYFSSSTSTRCKECGEIFGISFFIEEDDLMSEINLYYN